MMTIKKLMELQKRGHVHIVGRTSYRSAHLCGKLWLNGDRELVKDIEDSLQSQDNHVIVIVQALYCEDAGFYYLALHDFSVTLSDRIAFGEY